MATDKRFNNQTSDAVNSMLQIVTRIAVRTDDRTCRQLKLESKLHIASKHSEQIRCRYSKIGQKCAKVCQIYFASKKLRLNPTIIDLIFWRSYFQMRAETGRRRYKLLQKMACASTIEYITHQTNEAVTAVLQETSPQSNDY